MRSTSYAGRALQYAAEHLVARAGLVARDELRARAANTDATRARTNTWCWSPNACTTPSTKAAKRN